MTGGSASPENSSLRAARRYKRAEIAAPFLPYGLVPLGAFAVLLLVCLSFVAFNVIQSGAREAATRALSASGEDWARVRVSGQWVTLEGAPPSPESAQRATMAVRGARLQTWLGEANPVTRISTNFTSPPPQTNAAERPQSLLSARQGEPPADYLFRRRGERLILDGRMPGEALHGRVIEAARRLQASGLVTDITDQIEVFDGAVPEGFEAMALHSLEMLEACETGTSGFVDGGFRFHCEAEDEAADEIAERAAATLPEGIEADIEVLPREAVIQCEADIAQLLEAARIEFASGSATIQVASGPVLDLAAHAASDCPGTLRVSGHTDNTGSLQLNQELSVLRAEAVRGALIHRGVPAERIISVGYGPSRPIGDNATEEGRARNRRIEIDIVRPAE